MIFTRTRSCVQCAATDGARQELALRACQLLGAPLPPHAHSSNAPGSVQAHFYAASLAGLGPAAALMTARWRPDAQEPFSEMPTGACSAPALTLRLPAERC